MVGQIRPLGKTGAQSGIAKAAVDHELELGLTGFTADAQGDLKVHGGIEKAVHHYPHDHYAAWQADIGPHALLSRPGAFGENLSTSGLSEKNVAIGDIFKLGSAIIEVSQGRQPCWKLNERFSVNTMARKVQRTGRTGWYYRVLEPGVVTPSDRLVMIERRSPDWTIERIWRSFYVDTLNLPELEAIANLTALAPSWREHARRRIASGKVEDWTHRLDGK
ncbi:MAG: MOSC domain-containing protein [Allorhizobium sp.]